MAAAPRLLLPIRGADPRRRPAPELDLATLTGTPGDPVVPVVEGGALLVFSDVEALRRWRAPARFVTATPVEAEAVAARLGAREIVRDVNGPVRMRIPCDPRTEPVRTAHDVRALAGPLRPEAVDRLRDLLTRHPAVEAAWVVEATSEGTDAVVAAFDVAAAPAEARRLVLSLTEDVLPLLPVELYPGVQLVVLSDPETTAAVRAADEPVYVRS